MNAINRFLTGAALLTYGLSVAAAETIQTDATKVSAVTEAAVPSDLWNMVADDVAKIDGRTVRKGELAQAFAAQFPNGDIPETMTAHQIVSVAPQFLRQHIQTLLLLDLAKEAGVPMDSNLAYKHLKTEWEAFAGQDAKQLQTELEAQKTTLDDYAKELAARQAVRDTLQIQTWLRSTMKEKDPVTEMDIETFYDENKSQLGLTDGKEPEMKAVAAKIRRFLENRRIQELASTYIATAEKKRSVEYLLAIPPRGFGGCSSSGCSTTCD